MRSQNHAAPRHDSDHGLRRNVGSRDQAIDKIKVAEVLLVGVSIRAAVGSDIQPSQKINTGAIRDQYPLDYAALTTRLENRYIDFKANQKYHDIRKKLETSPQFKRTRLLDLANPTGLRKDYYSPNIVKEFDKHYTLRR